MTRAEVEALQGQVGADPAYDPAFGILLDYRGVTRFALDRSDMRRIAGNTPQGPAGRRAFVMAGGLGFGLARMFEAYATLAGRGGAVRVFHDDMEAALQWLCEPPEARP